jgi:hypothetical protein
VSTDDKIRHPVVHALSAVFMLLSLMCAILGQYPGMAFMAACGLIPSAILLCELWGWRGFKDY